MSTCVMPNMSSAAAAWPSWPAAAAPPWSSAGQCWLGGLSPLNPGRQGVLAVSCWAAGSDQASSSHPAAPSLAAPAVGVSAAFPLLAAMPPTAAAGEEHRDTSGEPGCKAELLPPAGAGDVPGVGSREEPGCGAGDGAPDAPRGNRLDGLGLRPAAPAAVPASPAALPPDRACSTSDQGGQPAASWAGVAPAPPPGAGCCTDAAAASGTPAVAFAAAGDVPGSALRVGAAAGAGTGLLLLPAPFTHNSREGGACWVPAAAGCRTGVGTTGRATSGPGLGAAAAAAAAFVRLLPRTGAAAAALLPGVTAESR